MELIKEYLQNPYDFLENTTLDKLIKIAKIADKHYYNDTSIMSDNEYDLIIDRIKFLDPNNKYLKKIGLGTEKKKVKLPYFMASMNKIKEEELIDNFKTKYGKGYCISDKLDGVSALLVIGEENKLYTRGNGRIGMDISHLLTEISIDTRGISSGIIIRGEIIITKNNFKKYEMTMSNSRNMISGIINSKKRNNLKDIDFVAYELIEPFLNVQEQFNFLNNTKLKIVNHIFVDTFTKTFLIDYLNKRKSESNYECDGIIINYIYPKKRLLDKNPDYAFAFKETNFIESVNVRVINVEWNISKDKYIKPRLILEPTKLSGVIIKHVTGFNAKFILDNKIGPGTIIKLIRAGDVIPHIKEIIKGTQEQMPEYKYRWNETKIDIIYEGENTEHLIKNLVWFCNKMEIQDINEKNITKMIDVGIDSISKIIRIEKTDLEKVSNFKTKMIDKIYKNIKEKINNIDIIKLMIASNIFGHGISDKRIKKIISIYPDIIYLYIEKPEKEMIKLISDIYGFDKLLAEQFIKNMSKFLDLLNELPQDIQDKILYEKTNNIDIIENKLMENLKIIFSGFRNKEWEAIIILKGGSIVSSISKNTNILVANKVDIENKKNSKIIKAIDLGIKILSKEEFQELFI
jgi:DNA ligase (NAD+)